MDITITLTMEQWNQVLDILSDGTVKRAMPLINTIMEQMREQIAKNGARKNNTDIPDGDPE